MSICIYHPTMGKEIARQVGERFPSMQVSVCTDVSRDPPGREHIEIMIANRFPTGLLSRCSRLRWLHLTGSGFEHVFADDPPAELLVTHSANVPARAVAEFVWMGLLALEKQTLTLHRQQRERQWRLPDARRLAGARMLLVGLGHIGQEIARRARGFEVPVTAVRASGRPSELADAVITPDRIAEVAPDCRYLVLAVPDNPTSRQLIDQRVIAALPAGAIVINIARSSALDVPALVAALRAGHLRGAMLDVHDMEPLPEDSPLWDVPNLLVTPHCAYRFHEEEEEVARTFVANLERFLEQQPLANPCAR